MEYYNANIQLDKEVIKDVFTEIKKNTKMLVFGLGYDSKMWYKGNHSNTFFVENNDNYIQMNINVIPKNNIIKYNYNTTCASSIQLTDDQIKKFNVPEKIMNEAPFDIIIIDGPEGYSLDKPGRLLPCYWSTLISKPGTVIYIDDANRTLETYCIKKYFTNNIKKEFSRRNKCIKVYM